MTGSNTPMKAPTDRQLSKWFAAQPSGPYTCTDCGHRGDKAYVQPQHPYFAEGKTGAALCAPCISKHHETWKIARKKQLDAEPRCELCNRRGAFYVGYARVLLCGAHKRKAEQAHNRIAMASGGLSLFLSPASYTADDVKRMAKS